METSVEKAKSEETNRTKKDKKNQKAENERQRREKMNAEEKADLARTKAQSWDENRRNLLKNNSSYKVVKMASTDDLEYDAYQLQAHLDMPVSYTHLTLPTICSV